MRRRRPARRLHWRCGIIAGVKLAAAVVLTGYILGQFLSCAAPSYNHYVKGKNLLLAGDCAGALAEFERGLADDPASPVLTYEQARCLYRLERWAEAKAAFERFLALTDVQKQTYADERWDAEFCIKKCRQALGEEAAGKDAGQQTEDGAAKGNEDTLGGITMVTK